MTRSPIGTVRIFDSGNVRVIVDALPELEPPTDKYEEGDKALQQIRNDDVLWFTARARVIDRITGTVLGEDYLGMCDYESLQDFNRPEGYMNDMIRAAISRARDSLQTA